MVISVLLTVIYPFFVCVCVCGGGELREGVGDGSRSYFDTT